MEANLVPNNWMFSSSRMPLLPKATAKFKAICPPKVGNIASGNSWRMIRATDSTVNGSI